MKTKTKIFLQYIVFAVILVLCVLYFRFLGEKQQKNELKQPVTENKVDSNVMDSNINVVNRSPLDSLLKEKQKLQDSLLMEVTGRSSGKAGYGQKAKAIQKQLEEIERTVEILQSYELKNDSLRK